jgi:hypothetical protein
VIGPRIFFCYRIDADIAMLQLIAQLIADMQIMGAEIILDDDDQAHIDLELLRREIVCCEQMIVVQTPEAIASLQVSAAISIGLELVTHGQMQQVLRLVAAPLGTYALPWMWEGLRTIDARADYTKVRDELLLTLGFSNPDSWADTQPSRSISLLSSPRVAQPLVLPAQTRTAYTPTARTVRMAPARLMALALRQKIQKKVRYALVAVALILIFASIGIALIVNLENLSATTNAAHTKATRLSAAQATLTAIAQSELVATQAAQAQAKLTVVVQTNAMAPKTAQSYHPRSYEAASPANLLSGGARVIDCRSCPGGKRVGFVGHGGILQFMNVVVSQTGNYTLRIYYSSSNNRTAYIRTNGGPGFAVAFPSTGSFSRVLTRTVVVHLNKGTNVIMFYNNDNWAPDFDKIVV